jgi:multiple sugar transport system substrate-binding protein
MVNALKTGLVPPGNINVTDSQGMQNLMARGQVASTFSDYSGNVGTLYNIKKSSSVAGKVKYIATPGASGPAANLSNPDGIGIPKQAKYPNAAAKFIEWFTATEQQADFAGVNGPEKTFATYPIPSHLSAVKQMTAKGNLIGGAELVPMLQGSKPVFEGGAPSWYPKFSNAVYTNLHAAATGSMSVEQAMKTIADTADQLASGS